MVCLGRSYHFKFFKGCLPQTLLGPFLNTLNQMIFERGAEGHLLNRANVNELNLRAVHFHERMKTKFLGIENQVQAKGDKISDNNINIIKKTTTK